MPPVRFRHSIGSPSLLQSARSPEGETSNESRQTFDVETLDQSSPGKCDSALLCDRVESNTTVQAQIYSSCSRNTTLSAFGENEVFEDRRNSDDGSDANNDLDNNRNIEINEVENKIDLATAFLLYQRRLKTDKAVIVQRDQRRLWQILFRRKFDLSQVQKYLWKWGFPGEAAEDLGGPIGEFLTLCMRRFPDLGFTVFGSSKSFWLTANAKGVLAEK